MADSASASQWTTMYVGGVQPEVGTLQRSEAINLKGHCMINMIL